MWCTLLMYGKSYFKHGYLSCSSFYFEPFMQKTIKFIKQVKKIMLFIVWNSLQDNYWCDLTTKYQSKCFLHRSLCTERKGHNKVIESRSPLPPFVDKIVFIVINNLQYFWENNKVTCGLILQHPNCKMPAGQIPSGGLKAQG